jgi:hypothetical protein
MVNYYKLAIPAVIVIVLAIGEMPVFLLAYNFYPEKHVNVNTGGKCYEFLDKADIQSVPKSCS